MPARGPVGTTPPTGRAVRWEGAGAASWSAPASGGPAFGNETGPVRLYSGGMNDRGAEPAPAATDAIEGERPGSEGGPEQALEGEERKLDRSWITLRRISRWIGVAVLAMIWAVVAVVLAFAGLPAAGYLAVVGAFGALVLLQAVLAHFWPAKAWRHASYRVTGRGIEIRRGVWWRQAVNVPRSRVQHTDVSQGPLERSFGLGTLVLYTAGTDHSRVELPGLAYDDASAIRGRLAAVDEDDAV